jgi:hypothetical protein
MLERKRPVYLKVALHVALAAMLVGCPENEPASIHVLNAVLAQPGCLFQAGGDQVQPYGTVDLTHNYHGYIAGLGWRNNLPQSAQVTQLTPESGLTETSTVMITGAHIEYEHNLGVDLPSGFFVGSASGALALEEAVAIVNILPPPVLDRIKESPLFVGRKPVSNSYIEQCLPNHSWENFPLGGKRGEVIVKVTLEGLTAGGLQVLSNEFHYSITVCNGCLVGGFGDFCSVFSTGVPGLTAGGPCGLGQDGLTSMFDLLSYCYQVDPQNVDALANCGNNNGFPASQAFIPSCLGNSFPSGTPEATNMMFQMYAAERCEKMFNIFSDYQVPGGQALTPTP